MQDNNISMVDNINQEIANFIKQIDKLNDAVIDATVNKDAELKEELQKQRDVLEAKKKAKEDKLEDLKAIDNLETQINKLNDAVIDATANKNAELKEELQKQRDALKDEKKAKEDKLEDLKGKCYDYKYLCTRLINIV